MTNSRAVEMRSVARRLSEVEGLHMVYDGFDSHFFYFYVEGSVQRYEVCHTPRGEYDDVGDVFECHVDHNDWYFYYNLNEEHEFMLAREEA